MPPPPAPEASSAAAMAAEQLSSRLDSVLSFGATATRPVADAVADARASSSDAGSSSSSDDEEEFEFSFAFAPPLAPADDLFSNGRLVPAYPVFDRRAHHLLDADSAAAEAPAAARASASSRPPSPDTYCDWAPRSAPGSPSRAFPKSASAGEARRHWRLRDLVAAGGRSHSDGKEKFVFLHQPAAAAPKASSTKASSTKAPAQQQQQKQGKKKTTKKPAAATEMDMATAHRLFYGKKQQQQHGAGDRRPQQQQSYLPYRPAIVGFFATARALGRSHHPY